MGIFRRLRIVIGGIVFSVNLIVNVVPLVLKLKIRIWDSVFLGLIVTLLLLVGLLALELDKHEKQEPGKSKWPRLKVNEEILYVMTCVARQAPMDGQIKMKRTSLAGAYMQAFKGKNLGDFNGLISKLAAREYFDISHVWPDPYCRITNEGFEYYDRRKNRKRWRNKINKLPPPPSGKITTVAQVGSI